MTALATLGLVLIIAACALLLIFGLFCVAVSIGTSRLEEHEHEPDSHGTWR